MSRTFLISDTHFGHHNILTFKTKEGNPLRPFTSIVDHDEHLIQQWNKTVRPNDKVYHLGDVGFLSWTKLAETLARLNGTKILIKGNHDHFKMSQYAQYFKDVRGSHILDKFILTHIPIHPESLSKWVGNLHGHLHSNSLDDERYFNLSVEKIDYTPMDFEQIRSLYNGYSGCRREES